MNNEEALKIAKSTNPLLVGSVNGEEKMQYVERIIYALENIDRIKAERDALMKDLKKVPLCHCCKHLLSGNGKVCSACYACLINADSRWEWRGVQNDSQT